MPGEEEEPSCGISPLNEQRGRGSAKKIDTSVIIVNNDDTEKRGDPVTNNEKHLSSERTSFRQ